MSNPLWPDEATAIEALRAADWEKLKSGRWIEPGGMTHSHSAAIAIAQIRLALGQAEPNRLTSVLTSELLAALVKRVVDLEQDFRDWGLL